MKFSFLMAVNKGHGFLGAAIDSVLNQTCSDFDFHIVANNCDDELWGYLKSFDDQRIKLYRSTIGQLAYSLNYGLDHIDSGYVLRMDSDDICPPERLQITRISLAELSWPDIMAGRAELIDETGKSLGYSPVLRKDGDITSSLWYKNPIVHPACAINVNTLKRLRGYSGGFMSEDFDLWLRASRDQSVRFSGVNSILIRYRVHSGQARGRLLGYAEGGGYRFREFLLTKNPKYLLGALVSAGKCLVRAR